VEVVAEIGESFNEFVDVRFSQFGDLLSSNGHGWNLRRVISGYKNRVD
jgi:hypothetical protein